MDFRRSIMDCGHKDFLDELDFGKVEVAGAVFASTRRLKKELEGDDEKNPVPADDEYILHKEFDDKGNLRGQIRMTYLEKLEVWDFMSPAQKRLQISAKDLKPKDRTTIEIDGRTYICNKEGRSKAAKETARQLRINVNNQQVTARGRNIQAKKKRK